VVLFRQPSVWERYWYLVVAVSSLCILQSVLVLALWLAVRRRRHAEEGLLREKTLADAVIESLPGIFVLQNRDGKNLRWNKNAETLARYNLAEVSPLGNVADKHREIVQRAKDEVFERGSSSVEADFMVSEGAGIAPYYFSGVRVELEGKPYLAAIGMDLTETKEQKRLSGAPTWSYVRLSRTLPMGSGRLPSSRTDFCMPTPPW
jgi:PAS domain-containing protein